mmetsp:Transcript_135050/g.234127  ORF Transcript_135050/g.234127 Transcript_135050/m.234127 type:complete len:108 (-) Transcript_135050:1247-1570(-)
MPLHFARGDTPISIIPGGIKIHDTLDHSGIATQKTNTIFVVNAIPQGDATYHCSRLSAPVRMQGRGGESSPRCTPEGCYSDRAKGGAGDALSEWVLLGNTQNTFVCW